MGLTNFPNGITSFGIPILGGYILPSTQGNVYHVKPYSGSDGNDGSSPDNAFKTLSYAHGKMTANQNDICLLYAEHNTAASTTDYQSSTLTWSKNACHLIGVNAGGFLSQRSRVALASTYDTASNLFTLSANNCLISGVEFFEGVAGTNPTGCFKVSGTRNRVNNCMIAGIGNDNNDIAGAYSLYLSGAAENLFEFCEIGLQTIDAGTNANSEILFDTASKNNKFRWCDIYRRIEHATNHPLVKVSGATGLDGITWFNACGFISVSTNDGYSNAGVFKFTATPTQGKVIVDPLCYATNGTTAGKWDVDDNNYIIVTGSPTPAADTAQIGRYV